MLSRDEILSSQERLGRRKVSTPEWADGSEDGHVFVRVLRGNELDDALSLLAKADDTERLTKQQLAGLCVLSICDEQGQRLFDESNIDELLLGPLAPLQRCAEAALEINGFTEKARNDLEGN